MEQIIDLKTKTIITLMNDLPDYKKVADDLKVAKLYKYTHSDDEDTFVLSLRKSFMRYIREGVLIKDLIQGEIPSPREAAKHNFDIEGHDDPDAEKPNLLHKKMIARKRSTENLIGKF